MRCGFCGDRLFWDYATQEWTHGSTGQAQGPDGHYAEARIRSLWASRTLLWIGIGVMIVILLLAAYDFLFCPGGPFFSETLC